jgi:hypothetical protein
MYGLQLEQAFPQYRRIWVQYSNNRGYRVCITLFPNGFGGYQMVFGSMNELSYDAIYNLLQEYLDLSK